MENKTKWRIKPKEIQNQWMKNIEDKTMDDKTIEDGTRWEWTKKHKTGKRTLASVDLTYTFAHCKYTDRKII